METSNPDKYEVAIADYRWKYVLYACVCWGLVLAGFLTFYNAERNWQFWLAELVMSMFAAGITYMLVSPKYSFIGRKGPKFEAYLNQKYNIMVSEDGSFSYNDSGFVFRGDEAQDISIQWNEISRISGHLEDTVSNDEDLVIRLEYGDNHFLEFDEEIAGWLKFRQEMRAKFGFTAEWQDRLISSGQKEIVIWERPEHGT